jgi:parallel beta-helix repeat protein
MTRYQELVANTWRDKQMIRARLRWLCATMIGLTLIVSSCSTSPNPALPGDEPPSSQVGPLPAECTSRITEPDQATTALQRAQPGNVMCLSGDGLVDAELAVTTSGTPQQPIMVVSDGATMRSLKVRADYVVIQGLTLRDGEGLTLSGRGLVARNNVIYNATADGVECRGCTDAIIDSNTVQRADGTGIWIAGERITVRNNTVSESVARTQDDADGVRFFGRGHRLTENTIKDISAAGYPRGGPHTDCFQTYDTRDAPPTYDVVIADNVCTNVDVQALIATNDERRGGGAPAGQASIIFERNTVVVKGSQAVLLRNFPDVVVRDNRFSGPGQRAIMITEGSTNCTVVGNIMTGDLRPFEIDPESERGFQESDNTSR